MTKKNSTKHFRTNLRRLLIQTTVFALLLISTLAIAPVARVEAGGDANKNTSTNDYFGKDGQVQKKEGPTCDGTKDGQPNPDKLNECLQKNSIVEFIFTAVNFLSAGVGIIITIMIIVGGIQYTSAGGDPGAVAAAKKRILNAVLALVAFIFMYTVIQWLVPGGIF